MQKFAKAGSESWTALTAALAESRAAFDKANKAAWDKLPPDLQAIVAKNINAAGVKERADVAELNASLQKDLASKGMVFNATNAALFRDHLRKANFYSDWKAKFGDEGWAVLERSVGKLS